MEYGIIMWIIFWMALSVVLFFVWENRKVHNAISKSDTMIKQAEEKRENILRDAQSQKDKLFSEGRKESEQLLTTAKNEAHQITLKAEKAEERITEREERIQTKLEEIEKKQDEVFKHEESLSAQKNDLDKKAQELDGKLSEISKLTEQQAKELFIKQLEEKYAGEWKTVIEKYKKRTEERKEEEAREIILKSIQQYASDVTSEVTTTVIEIPSDDIKWKLIWKEGRNITTFEKNAGVSLIIDDTPDTVFISGFDLYRRYIAKKSLEKLIEDGRIQPARIEEVIKNTEDEADILLKNLWSQILEELWIDDIPDTLIPLIWKLRFRTSYGQNILKHSKEVALIAESIARDLGVDQKLARKWGLLHDLGKALDHDIEWTHPELWARVARKYGLAEEVVDMIENHHWEQFSISIYAAIVQVADAISSVRPGARREAIENYVKRVQEMEALVQSFSWVNKAYALSAGREVRVFVDATTVSDIEAQETAKKIAENIQEKLSYPGEVKVSVIREMRVIEFAK